jgi:hypothetical protein
MAAINMNRSRLPTPSGSPYETMLDRIYSAANARGLAYQNQKKSVQWMRDRAASTGKRQLTPEHFQRDIIRLHPRVFLGQMYMFQYDPKWKKELPFYDRFPIIFPIRFYDDGFLGMNFHYLPLTYRAKLMDALMDSQLTNQKFDETTRMKASYQILKSAAKYKYFVPTIKRYLYDHVRSEFIYILPSEWSIALFLPTQRFSKATEQEVWKESRRIIRGL